MLDKTTGEFQHFTSEISGLPNDVVYGILPGQKRELWMSTNRGLSRLTVDNGRVYRFRNFREFDGLQSDEFNTGAFARNPDGRLFFGGVNGLTVFNPSEIVERTSDADVLITGLKNNNLYVNFRHTSLDGSAAASIVLNRPVHLTESVTLRHTQNLVTLEFALMDFTNPQENRFRYRLIGSDPNWVEAGTNHAANYAQMRPGNYTFEVHYLRYISESLHSLANAQNVMLKVESNEAAIFMDYDPERLLQIVHNLLSNAIKFTPSG